MGSIGAFLGGGRRAGIGEEKLETRMDMRFMKELIYNVVKDVCIAHGILEPDEKQKRRRN